MKCLLIWEPAGLGDVEASIPIGAAEVKEGDSAIEAKRSDEAVAVNFISRRVKCNVRRVASCVGTMKVTWARSYFYSSTSRSVIE